MKSALLWFVAGVFMLSLSAGRAAAQNCVTYDPDYSVYADASTDGTSLYTSVEIEGSGTMTILDNYGCSSLNLNEVTHTPSADNAIGGVGGWLSGTPECPVCYLSAINDQSIVATPGATYTFNWGAEVYCSIGGYFFNTSGLSTIALTTTYGEYESLVDTPDTIQCNYAPACTNASATIPTCGHTVMEWIRPAGNACPYYARGKFAALKVDGVTECSVGFIAGAAGPGPCS